MSGMVSSGKFQRKNLTHPHQNLYQNNTKSNMNANDYELVIIPMNTGVFVNEKGTSSTFIALLTKEDVIQASSQEPYTNHEVKRMVGGSFLSGLKSSLG